jgi:hypothetical protein
VVASTKIYKKVMSFKIVYVLCFFSLVLQCEAQLSSKVMFCITNQLLTPDCSAAEHVLRMQNLNASLSLIDDSTNKFFKIDDIKQKSSYLTLFEQYILKNRYSRIFVPHSTSVCLLLIFLFFTIDRSKLILFQLKVKVTV